MARIAQNRMGLFGKSRCQAASARPVPMNSFSRIPTVPIYMWICTAPQARRNPMRKWKILFAVLVPRPCGGRPGQGPLNRNIIRLKMGGSSRRPRVGVRSRSFLREREGNPFCEAGGYSVHQKARAFPFWCTPPAPGSRTAADQWVKALNPLLQDGLELSRHSRLTRWLNYGSVLPRPLILVLRRVRKPGQEKEVC